MEDRERDVGAVRLDFQCSLRADPDWKTSPRPRSWPASWPFSALCEPILIGSRAARLVGRPAGCFQCSLRADPDWKSARTRRWPCMRTFSALCEPILIGSATPPGSQWSRWSFSALCEPILIGSPEPVQVGPGGLVFQCSLRADPDWKLEPPDEDALVNVFQCSLRADPDWKAQKAGVDTDRASFSALCEPILIGRRSGWRVTATSSNLSVLSASRS